METGRCDRQRSSGREGETGSKGVGRCVEASEDLHASGGEEKVALVIRPAVSDDRGHPQQRACEVEIGARGTEEAGKAAH